MLVLVLFLKTVLYGDFCNLIPYILYFVITWLFFLKSNFWGSKINKLSTDTLSSNSPVKKTFHVSLNNYYLLSLILFLSSFFFMSGHESVSFWGHLQFNNFNIQLTQMILILIVAYYALLSSLSGNSSSYNSDFFFSVSNIILYSTLLFLTNTIYSFIFVLELSSITIFYNFVTARVFFKSDPYSTSQITNKNPQNYLSMLLFQYWSTFFSSILIFFSIISIYVKYNSTEFFFINYMIVSSELSIYSDKLFDTFIWVILTVGILLKLSITPFHLFKLEVYKGLPLLGILFYTTVYFLVNFIFFSIFLNFYLSGVKSLVSIFFIAYLVISIVYLISLLFDISSIKSFLGYSTIVNSMIFILLLFFI